MEIHIGNRVADVSLVNKEGNKVQLTIDGKPYEVDIVMAENGSCSILHEGNSYNAELIQKESKKSYFLPFVPDRYCRYSGKISAYEKRRRYPPGR